MGHLKRMGLHRFGSLHFHRLNPALSYSLCNSSRTFLSLFSTVASSPSPASAEQISIVDYLSTNFKFSKAQSVRISKRLSKIRSPQHPWTVLDYFKQIGLSESQIQTTISRQPEILLSHVDKTLKPKIEYFQLLGFQGLELGEFLSKNGLLLMRSLNKAVVPCVECLRKLLNDEKDLIKLLRRHAEWIIPNQQRVLDNAAFFKSCGIVGSQLSVLLTRRPRLFVTRQSLLRNYVSRAVNMGFSIDSGMLVYGFRIISDMSIVMFNRKVEIIQSCGFSKDEAMQMFRRSPGSLGMSEKRLKFKIQVFLDKIMLPRSLLVNNPVILTMSMEKRVIPRWRVLQLLMSKNLL
ncbi:transcription termination factor MTERF4, chloroplastic-like [Neltuma alba]|uniref:transcription termination factor MTERF4, chloroplastic-like n=1 Tax=Neltuma alba TaxID=207710 RepID=UPI0010A2F6A2|nr:transcription termination factor MTERF4, chloroplastic-like [Prosopis alba]